MMRLLVAVLAVGLGITAAPAANRVVAPSGLTALQQLMWNAQGTYAASTLPKMCVNGHTATADAARTLSLMTTLKTNCARIDWNWDVIETSAGTYTWTNGFNAFFSPVCAAGIDLLFLATYNNPLYASQVFTPVTAGANATAWGNFGKAEITNVKSLGCTPGKIEAYNEPNLPFFVGGVNWLGNQYAPVFATFASTVKGTHATTPVFAGGLTPGNGIAPTPWIAQMVGQGSSLASFDYYSLHPYNYVAGTPTLTPLPDQIVTDTLIFAAASKSSGTIKPIAITEYGFPWTGLSTTIDQAMLNKQGVYYGWAMLDTIIANVTLGSPGVPYFYVYDMVDDGIDYSATSENSFGLFFNTAANGTLPVAGSTSYGIKPSGTAFVSVTTAMQSATSYTVSLDVANKAPSIAFLKPTGVTFAIWTTDASSSKSYSAAIGSFSSVSCKDLIGNTVSCPYSAGNLSVTLSTATGPIIATALN